MSQEGDFEYRGVKVKRYSRGTHSTQAGAKSSYAYRARMKGGSLLSDDTVEGIKQKIDTWIAAQS